MEQWSAKDRLARMVAEAGGDTDQTDDALRLVAEELATTRRLLERLNGEESAKAGNGSGNGNGKRISEIIGRVIQALLVPLLIASGALQIKLLSDISVLQATVVTKEQLGTVRTEMMMEVRDRFERLPTPETKNRLDDHETRLRDLERIHRGGGGTGSEKEMAP